MDTADSPDTARKKLAELRDNLKRNNFFCAADCLGAYLEGRAKSLDEAFGIKSRIRRGRPTENEARDLRIAREMLNFRLARSRSSKAGTIYAEEERIAEREGISDAREVRRIYKRLFPQVAGDEIRRRLSGTRKSGD